jgi:hypothetical protein
MAIFEKTMVEVRNLVREQITQSHQEIQRNGSNLGLSPNAKIKVEVCTFLDIVLSLNGLVHCPGRRVRGQPSPTRLAEKRVL